MRAPVSFASAKFFTGVPYRCQVDKLSIGFDFFRGATSSPLFVVSQRLLSPRFLPGFSAVSESAALLHMGTDAGYSEEGENPRK